MRHLLSIASLACVLLVPALAEAAPPEWDEGVYVQVAPGALAVELQSFGLNWQGGVGAGYMWKPASNFHIELGGAVSHMIGASGVNGSMLRLVPEFRIGGGWSRFWFCGLFGPGFALVFYESGGNTHADPAFNFRTAGGGQILVWRGLYVGLEAWFDFAVFGGGFVPVGGPRALVGWKF